MVDAYRYIGKVTPRIDAREVSDEHDHYFL